MFARYAQLDDIDSLLSLESSCWEKHLQASRERIENRITENPKNQFVVVEGGEVCGVLYTQLIENKTKLTTGLFKSQESLNSPEGSLLQLLAIAVKSSQGGNSAAFLRDFALKSAKSNPQVFAHHAGNRPAANSL